MSDAKFEFDQYDDATLPPEFRELLTILEENPQAIEEALAGTLSEGPVGSPSDEIDGKPIISDETLHDIIYTCLNGTANLHNEVLTPFFSFLASLYSKFPGTLPHASDEGNYLNGMYETYLRNKQMTSLMGSAGLSSVKDYVVFKCRFEPYTLLNVSLVILFTLAKYPERLSDMVEKAHEVMGKAEDYYRKTQQMELEIAKSIVDATQSEETIETTGEKDELETIRVVLSDTFEQTQLAINELATELKSTYQDDILVGMGELFNTIGESRTEIGQNLSDSIITLHKLLHFDPMMATQFVDIEIVKLSDWEREISSEMKDPTPEKVKEELRAKIQERCIQHSTRIINTSRTRTFVGSEALYPIIKDSMDALPEVSAHVGGTVYGASPFATVKFGDRIITKALQKVMKSYEGSGKALAKHVV